MLSLPTLDDFSQLTRWAKVAFAARCAKRVSRLSLINMRSAAGRVNRAIEVAEESARRGNTNPDAEKLCNECLNTITPAVHLTATLSASSSVPSVQSAAYAIKSVCELRESAFLAMERSVGSMRGFANGFFQKYEFFQSIIAAPIRDDFDYFVQHSKSILEDTPVDPAAVGPLWPDHLAETVPGVHEATERLRKLMIEQNDTASVEWKYDLWNDFPNGLIVEINVNEWQLVRTEKFDWRNLLPGYLFEGTLYGVWYNVLRDRVIQEISSARLEGV